VYWRGVTVDNSAAEVKLSQWNKYSYQFDFRVFLLTGIDDESGACNPKNSWQKETWHATK